MEAMHINNTVFSGELIYVPKILSAESGAS
jgi:hypothetical protein